LSPSSSSFLTEAPADLARAAELLRGGVCVALPTETVYGLAADATNPAALAQVFSIKGRPLLDPLIVHVLDQAALAEVAEPDPRLAEARFALAGPADGRAASQAHRPRSRHRRQGHRRGPHSGAPAFPRGAASRRPTARRAERQSVRLRQPDQGPACARFPR
jgi:hypothetical protein